MQLAYERAPGGFDDIELVVPYAERAAIADRYKSAAGFVPEQLNRAREPVGCGIRERGSGMSAKHTTVFERHPATSVAMERALADTVARPFWIDDLGTDVARYPALAGDAEADLVVVGGGYTGLWTALRAKRARARAARRAARGAARRVGGVGSQRRILRGEPHPRRGERQSRWPDEMRRADAARPREPRRHRADGRAIRDGLRLRAHRHARGRDRAAPGGVAGGADADGRGRRLPRRRRRAGRDRTRPPTSPGAGSGEHRHGASGEARRRARARVAESSGSWSRGHRGAAHRRRRGPGVEVVTDRGTVGRRACRAGDQRVPVAAQAQPAHDGAGLRLRAHDRAAHRRRSSRDRLAATGRAWATSRTSSTTTGSAPTTGSCSAATTRSTTAGRKVRAEYEDRRESFGKLASHFVTTFPQLEGVGFTHRWAGAIDTSTRFCAFYGTGARGRVAYAAGFTGLGVGAARFAADVMLDRLGGHETERTSLAMVAGRPWPFPPEPVASIGIQPRVVARPGRSPPGPPQPAAEGARRARPRVRLVTSR